MKPEHLYCVSSSLWRGTWGRAPMADAIWYVTLRCSGVLNPPFETPGQGSLIISDSLGIPEVTCASRESSFLHVIWGLSDMWSRPQPSSTFPPMSSTTAMGSTYLSELVLWAAPPRGLPHLWAHDIQVRSERSGAWKLRIQLAFVETFIPG